MIAVLALLSVVGIGPAAPPSDAVVRMRVFAPTSVDADTLSSARRTLQAVLAPSGVSAEWRSCSPAAPCEAGVDADTAPPLVVRLLPVARPLVEDVCGQVVWDARTRMPIIFIYLPPVADKLLLIQRSPLGRTNPRLARIQIGELIGLIVAHEIGHAVGLQHSAWGVMKENIETRDVLALLESRLLFPPDQGAQMRLALRQGGEGMLAAWRASH